MLVTSSQQAAFAFVCRKSNVSRSSHALRAAISQLALYAVVTNIRQTIISKRCCNILNHNLVHILNHNLALFDQLCMILPLHKLHFFSNCKSSYRQLLIVEHQIPEQHESIQKTLIGLSELNCCCILSLDHTLQASSKAVAS